MYAYLESWSFFRWLDQDCQIGSIFAYPNPNLCTFWKALVRVTRWFCKKNCPNCSPSHYCQNYYITLLPWNKVAKNLGYFSNFEKTAESWQMVNGRKFAQSGHTFCPGKDSKPRSSVLEAESMTTPASRQSRIARFLLVCTTNQKGENLPKLPQKFQMPMKNSKIAICR
jgi:hypothetical protein